MITRGPLFHKSVFSLSGVGPNYSSFVLRRICRSFSNSDESIFHEVGTSITWKMHNADLYNVGVAKAAQNSNLMHESAELSGILTIDKLDSHRR